MAYNFPPNSLYGLVYTLYGSCLLHFVFKPMDFSLCTSKGYKSPGNLNLIAFSMKLEGTSYVYTRIKLSFIFKTKLGFY